MQKTFHKIRAFSLVDQEGKAFTEKNLDGKIVWPIFSLPPAPAFAQKWQ